MRKLIPAVLSLALVAAVAALFAIPAFASTTRTVKMRDNVFVPSTLTVRKNTTLKFVWAGQSPHNVSVSKGPMHFRSGTKTKGSAYRKKMTRRGTYTLVCTVHPGMDLKLKVT